MCCTALLTALLTLHCSHVGVPRVYLGCVGQGGPGACRLLAAQLCVCSMPFVITCGCALGVCRVAPCACRLLAAQLRPTQL